MNKNAIQKYAVWARNELIEQIKQRAYQYGITEKGYGDENAIVISGRVLSPEEKRQRHEFIAQIKEHGYQQAVEEVAYTWFNRFVALRYMEVNDYLPTHVRVFSDASGSFNPEILKDVLHLDLPELDKAKVSDLLNANKTEELYRYLLLTQCNALNEALPEMFERMGSYTEMLLPNNILKPDSILGRLVMDIPEEDFRDAVQIIGWMYQYYNTEPKQAVFDGLKKNIKITKEKIPAATQLFTPDWIVRYMVENSLGRIFIGNKIQGLGSSISESERIAKEKEIADKMGWRYYIPEAEQTPEVRAKLRILRSQSPLKSPEDIRFIDPCMGSGHILVYAFDVLMQIYESEGYNPREAAKLILEKNIYGLDIDRRAYQLAYFSLMMKARQYNRRIFNEDVKPQVYHPAGWSDGEEYGSLVKVDKLENKPEEKGVGEQIEFDDNYERDLRIWNFKRLLVQKYDVVVTNPPYAGSSGVNGKLSEFLKTNYPDTKSDMFAAFIERCLSFLKPAGFTSMITQQAWMFLASYEKLRYNINSSNSIENMIHLGNGSFGFADFGLTCFTIRASHVENFIGTYVKLVADNNPEWKEKAFLSGRYRYYTNNNNFRKIPSIAIAYWVHSFAMFDFEKLSERFVSGGRNKTHNNELYVKCWWEIFDRTRWVPYANGGDFRKWYGNYIDLVDWSESATDFYNQHGGLLNQKYWNKEGITWGAVTSGSNAFRIKESEFVYSSASPTIFNNSFTCDYSLLGFLNSKVSRYIIRLSNPTVNLNPNDILSLPYNGSKKEQITADIVMANISLSRTDWDSFETSWDFKRHPMICDKQTIAAAYEKWKNETIERFEKLKANEEELNRIFIDIYGLQDELTPEVEDKDVTVYRIFDSKEDIPESMAGSRYALTKQDAIKSFISYAVGCMFGRYSLDAEGLAYAGGEWDAGKYESFIPDKDNIIPICDDEYFGDDIAARFIKFVEIVYGAEWLENNLQFIADALGGKGTSREVIRNYFLNGFYADHCKTYQKRPIYWLFDSGKKNGFKALIYMHRYSRDLLAKLRTDYVHEQQERYRTQLLHIADALNTATGAERARLLKQQEKLTEQLKEITAFEEKVHHLADQNIEIDLDDGVKKNYEIFADILAKI